MHKHRITPGHMEGTYTPNNVIKLTVQEHANWHYELWVYYGCWEDYIAWKALSGQISMSEASKEARKQGCIIGGKISGNTRRGQKISDQGRKNISEGRKGMKLSSNHVANVVDSVSRTWKMISPTGEEFIVKNKNEFCKLHNLTPNTMTVVAQGKQTNHKGWGCIKLK